MKVAVILVVAMVMMMGQEAQGWGAWRRTVAPVLNRFPIVRQVSTGVRVIRSAVRRLFRRWGKREVRDADFDAAFNAAAEDGILSDDEIQSVFGVSAEELAAFKESFDMDGNGEISVAEYIAVTMASEEGQDE